MGFFRKLSRGITGLLVRGGLCTVKFIAAILLGVIKSIKFILSEIWELIKAVGGILLWILGEITESFRSRIKVSNELTKNIRMAKKEGGKTYAGAIVRFVGSFLFGEGGVLYTAFNYILPIVSAAFLIGVVKQGSGLEYGLAVEFNGKEVGIINNEADFEAAEREVNQRISFSDAEEPLEFTAKYSLRIISDSDHFVSSSQLANEMLAASDEELTTAYGIYMDGNFIGAVRNRDMVQEALMDNLLNYKVDGIVHDVSYVNKIDYEEGIYLLSSVQDEQSIIDLLTSSKEKQSVYVVQEDDSAVTICQKFGMTLDKFNELNPSASEAGGIRKGLMLNVVETESYMPVQYVRELETLSFLDYETVEVETSALNVGYEAVLVKGVRGEKHSNVEITYVDGIERSRRILSSKITKQPVVEQIGIGTYSAKPDSPNSVLNGDALHGTGEFGWPVDGGWISDTFISDRNHKGLDIAAASGTNIYAAGEGVVVSAGWNSGGYGNVVMIDHLNGYQTVYGHMSYVVAVEGQTVTKGQLIGLVGSTGDSTGPHCHFEVRYEGVCNDPASYLNTEEKEEKD